MDSLSPHISKLAPHSPFETLIHVVNYLLRMQIHFPYRFQLSLHLL
jgi:hypothetical protein